ncbi:hypothetical protein EAF04_006119 [Stromatinia cepivora]|nr:hypothetical protein EAF04_006119 [Stromatinia cepivora]
MAFHVFDAPGQGAYFVILVVSAVVCIVALVLRILATNISARKLGLEDWLAVGAVAVFLARDAVAIRALTIINGRGLELATDLVAYENAFKLVFVSDVITMLDQSLAKLSICALYYRIFGVKRRFAL